MSQMLKPGGILMLMEGYLQLYDEVLNVVQPTGGVAKFLFEVVARQASPNGLGLDRIGENLEGWVRKNGGFKNIQTHILYVPVGWSGSPGVCKEPIAAGRLMMDNMKVCRQATGRASAADGHVLQTFLRAWDPMFISMGVPEAEVNQWVSEAREQLEDPDKLRVYTKWIIVCGEKVE
ncbi:hypothetical protein FRC10_004668 [Ceratobasidium sp. 414]|nr:hypothetical protein FRC10_004668 [Ceratobasidium sp. 414]